MNAVQRPLTMWLLATLASGNVRPASDDAARRPVLVVVLHNYAAIAPRVLEEAAREVARAYAALDIDVRWIAPLVKLDQPGDILNETLVATIHLRLFERDGRDRAFTGVIGIDAPRAAGSLMTVAHVLYEPIGDESTSALALAHVTAHVMGNVAMTRNGSRPSTILQAGRREAERLQRGESPFTPEEADRIRAGAWSVGR
jgi:hypothetical protein